MTYDPFWLPVDLKPKISKFKRSYCTYAGNKQ